MTRATREVPWLERVVRARVLVLDDVVELASLNPGVPIVRSSLDAMTSVEHSVTGIIVDRSRYDVFQAAVPFSRFAGVPVMVLADSSEPDDALESLPADDVVLRPVRQSDLARRVRLLAELGRGRAEGRCLHGMLVDRETFDHAILDGVDVGIVTADEGGKVTFVNRAASEMLRLEGTAAGGDARALLGLIESPHELLASAPRRCLSYTLLSQDGAELDLELSVSRAEGTAHERVGFFFIFRDLTDDKLRETERRRFERLAAMGTMVAGFAHEVRNPVASLRALTEALNEELLENHLVMPHIGRMHGALDRVERLVSTSLQFGRPAVPKRAPHPPWQLISHVLAALGPRTRELGGQLRVEIEPELPHVLIDEAQLVQVLVILANNALDATGSSQRVHLRVARTKAADADGRTRKSQPPPGPPRVRFEVIDEGPGVPPDIASRIFDPFFTTKPTGTGLGLSIAQQIIGENGARLEFSSTRGGPTMFAVVVTPAR